MCNQYVKSLMPEQFEPQLCGPALHLPLRVLVLPRAVAHGTAQPQDPYPFMDINLILNADTSLRRNAFIFAVMVPMYIQNRYGRESHQKGKVVRIQISAGYDQVDSIQFALFIKIPQILRLLIRNCQYLHTSVNLPFSVLPAVR